MVGSANTTPPFMVFVSMGLVIYIYVYIYVYIYMCIKKKICYLVYLFYVLFIAKPTQ